MSDGIVIIGSGFAARQLVKNIRKQDAQIPLTLIAADSMDEYNKPDLSHVISRGQKADDLTLQSAGEFAEQYTLRLFPHTWVSDIDAENRLVKSHDNQWRYDKLVLATGATPFIPSVPGRELMLTLNSQREYGAAQSQLHDAKRVLIVGGGLIGCELAMDFCRAGKAVTVVDNSASVLAALMPLGVLAQPININNNPNQPGYVVPSQQRMQNEMKVQQQQQQSMLKQDLNNQTRSQQQHLQNQLQTNQQRAAQGGNLNAPQQVRPNNNGGMLRQTNP
jgi:NADPH-dependent 2,4-dienoyl-CoA reductase/sulfur reductase-like enzyme